MNRSSGWAVLSLALVLGGCSGQEPAENAAPASPPAQQQAAEPAPAPEAGAPAAPEGVPQAVTPEPAPTAAAPAATPQPQAEAPRPVEAKTAPPAALPTPAVQPAQAVQAAPQEPAPAAAKAAVPKDVIVLTGSPLGGVRLEHKLHATRVGNNCATCHDPSRPGKLHEPMAQSGTCIDCHKAENAKGKKAPVNCMDCHKQENKS
jgi:hypothetical protein